MEKQTKIELSKQAIQLVKKARRNYQNRILIPRYVKIVNENIIREEEISCLLREDRIERFKNPYPECLDAETLLV